MKYEITRIWKMRKVEVTTLVIEALGTVTRHFDKCIGKSDLDLTIKALQMPCLLETVRVIQKVLHIK